MHFETLKQSKIKYYIIGGVLLIGVLGILIVKNTFSKYRTTQSINIVNGTINYKVPDLRVVALYTENDNGDYIETTDIPTSGYTLNIEKSVCKVYDGTTSIEEAPVDTSITINYENGVVNVLGINKKNTRCYLYFDSNAEAAKNYILSKITPNDGEPDFTKTATTDEGMYTAEDDDGTSYYYRGAVENNYFYFAGYYWRIVRINGDGTIRLIYQGTTANGSGSISTSTFNEVSNDNMYVGYMYTSGNAHGTGTDSTIKGVLDNWYNTNLTNYSSYIADSGFCGDRYGSTSSTNAPDGTGGTGTSTTYYGARYRLYTTKTPSLKCVESSDLYTTSDSNKGNKALTYSIGLVTADEVAFAGNVYNSTNTSYYLYSGSSYWTLSPTYYNGTTSAVLYVNTSGYTTYGYTTNSYGVRPVININKDVELEGTGTSSDPFKIKGTEIKVSTASETILANITVNTGTPNFSQAATTDEGVYAAEDGMYGGTSYYWRGAVTNNYITFGGFCWRIVRINGDGSIRLIYDGTTCHANGTSTTNSIAIADVAYNASQDASYYAGWSYTLGEQHGTSTDSTARMTIENWYTNHLLGYADYIADGKYCNDREVASGYTWSASGSTFEYSAYERTYSTYNPTLYCTNSKDIFILKIGLIAADEIMLAGGIAGGTNMSYYLYNGNYYWTMTPYYIYSRSSTTYVAVYAVVSDGDYGLQLVADSAGLRPVINLNSTVTFSSGNGTQSQPYVVAT